MGKKASQLALPSYDGLVRRSVDISVRAVNEEERSIEFTASTESIDSHGDVVEQSFDLKRFKKNPVLLWHHNSFGFFDGARAEDFLPIGHVKNISFESGELEGKAVFVDERANPLAEKVFQGFSQRSLRGFSIGFRPGTVTEETVEGGTRFRLADNELFEISAVPIPSNPDAVAKAHQRVEIERKELARRAQQSGQPSRKKMDEEQLKAELDKVKAELAVAKSKAADLETRATGAESKLKAEQKLNEELSKQNGELSSKLKDATKAERETTIKAFTAKQSIEIDGKATDIGAKITPGEVESYVKLAEDLGDGGLDRVKSLLCERADITITDPVNVDGKGVHRPASDEERAGSAADETKDAAGDIVNLALERARKSA